MDTHRMAREKEPTLGHHGLFPRDSHHDVPLDTYHIPLTLTPENARRRQSTGRELLEIRSISSRLGLGSPKFQSKEEMDDWVDDAPGAVQTWNSNIQRSSGSSSHKVGSRRGRGVLFQRSLGYGSKNSSIHRVLSAPDGSELLENRIATNNEDTSPGKRRFHSPEDFRTGTATIKPRVEGIRAGSLHRFVALTHSSSTTVPYTPMTRGTLCAMRSATSHNNNDIILYKEDSDDSLYSEKHDSKFGRSRSLQPKVSKKGREELEALATISPPPAKEVPVNSDNRNTTSVSVIEIPQYPKINSDDYMSCNRDRQEQTSIMCGAEDAKVEIGAAEPVSGVEELEGEVDTYSKHHSRRPKTGESDYDYPVISTALGNHDVISRSKEPLMRPIYRNGQIVLYRPVLRRGRKGATLEPAKCSPKCVWSTNFFLSKLSHRCITPPRKGCLSSRCRRHDVTKSFCGEPCCFQDYACLTASNSTRRTRTDTSVEGAWVSESEDTYLANFKIGLPSPFRLRRQFRSLEGTLYKHTCIGGETKRKYSFKRAVGETRKKLGQYLHSSKVGS